MKETDSRPTCWRSISTCPCGTARPWTGPSSFGWRGRLFKQARRVPGIAGLNVAPELYADDPYFIPRFGTGHLRYLCFERRTT